MSIPGGFNFEQLRCMVGQLGLNAEDLDINELVKQMQRPRVSGGIRFGIISTVQGPDAAWRTTITVAHYLASELGPDPSLLSGEKLAIVGTERLAQSQLGSVTRFASPRTPSVTLRREDWIESISAGWRRLVEPITDGLADALQRDTAIPEDPQFVDLSSMLAPMIRTSASLIYRGQLGKVSASVTGSALTDLEVGISLAQGSAVTVLPASIAEFIRDLDLSDGGVVFYLLLREAPGQRLFYGVGWLSSQLDTLLAHYAREIRVDFEVLSSQLDISGEGVSLEDTVAIREKVCGSFFESVSIKLQLEILDRLEMLLALIEGWVDHVTNRAVSSWTTNSAQLDEVVRRRRASVGPTHEVPQDLLGLELRPRLVRGTKSSQVAMGCRHGATEHDGM